MGAFSEMAARSYFCEHVRVDPQADFEGLFNAVSGGVCTHGMVPIENSLMGSIHENYDLLLQQDLYIVGEIKLRIVHNLIVNPGVRMEDVRQIYSQAPALAQCTEFIRSTAGVEAVVAHDTAGAVKQIKEENARDAAAIASAQAAVDYDLEILREGLENDHRNYTRFWSWPPNRLILSILRRPPSSIPWITSPERCLKAWAYLQCGISTSSRLNRAR